MLYLLTFTCYGSHLPGDPRGSFDHVRAGDRRFVPPNPALEAYHRRHMTQPPFLLSTPLARVRVREAIVEVCHVRSWFLYALHVRTNHVHGVVEANSSSSRVLNDWKAYATRRLRAVGEQPSAWKPWSHGGSARRILTPEDLRRAMEYVLLGQGQPLEMYCADPRSAATPALTGRAETVRVG